MNHNSQWNKKYTMKRIYVYTVCKSFKLLSSQIKLLVTFQCDNTEE